MTCYLKFIIRLLSMVQYTCSNLRISFLLFLLEALTCYNILDSLLDDSETQQQTKSVAQIVKLLFTVKPWFDGLTDTKSDLNNEQNKQIRAHLERINQKQSHVAIQNLGFLLSIMLSQLVKLLYFSDLWYFLEFC